jgi:DNA-binding response OmpR family regulator
MELQRILVIESEDVTRLMAELQLQQAGYNVTTTDRAAELVDRFRRERFDLVLIDLCRNIGDAMRAVVEARTWDPELPVIAMIGATSAPRQIAAGSQHIHRYLIKPVAPNDLVRAVVEALSHHRRLAERAADYRPHCAEQTLAPVLHVGPLRIDRRRRRVTHDGQALPLSSGEFALLSYLAQRRGSVVSHQELVRDVLRYPCSLQEARDLAKSHVHRLRRKIAQCRRVPALILSVRGAGYRLADEDELGDYAEGA